MFYLFPYNCCLDSVFHCTWNSSQCISRENHHVSFCSNVKWPWGHLYSKCEIINFVLASTYGHQSTKKKQHMHILNVITACHNVSIFLMVNRMPGIQKVHHDGSSNSDWELTIFRDVSSTRILILTERESVLPLVFLSSEMFFSHTSRHNQAAFYNSQHFWFNFNTIPIYNLLIWLNFERKKIRILLCNHKALGALIKSSTELHTSCLDTPRLWIQVFLPFLALSYHIIPYLHPASSNIHFRPSN